MKKVIALVRTSTIQQEVESQKQEVINYIKNDGIAEDIIIVGSAGASAIKLDEAYKSNLNHVYSLIEGGEIAAVYAWAIDRIGRNEEVLMRFKNVLVSNKVQLVIVNPTMRLLNDDGSVNGGMEIAFSLFATMAKQEMENKKARFSRAKKRNKEQGKYNGGKVRFGYAVDADGNYYVNEEEAEVVRLVFNLYNSGEYSLLKLVRELNARGYTNRGKAIQSSTVDNIIHRAYYTGEKPYPRIISNQLFEAVQKRLKNNFTQMTKESKHTHLCTKLIVCTHCGRHYYATDDVYQCAGHKANKAQRCGNTECLSVQWLDVAALYVAKTCELEYIINHTEVKAEQAQREIEVNLQKIEVLKKSIAKVDERKRKIAENYENDLYTREEMQTKIAKVKEDVAAYERDITTLQETNAKLQAIVHFDEEGTLIRTGRLTVMGINENVELAYKLTHKHIKCITAKDHNHEGKVQKLITITTVMGEVYRFIYMPKAKAKTNGRLYKLMIEREGKFVLLPSDKDMVVCGIG